MSRSPILQAASLGNSVAAAALLLTASGVWAQSGTASPATEPALTLREAIALAEKNEPALAAARAEQQAALLDHSIARAALLPGVVYHNQVFYTQPNGARNAAGALGTQPAPVFIANNAVREYANQASITEVASAAQAASVRAASAAAARATAELEIARRGVVAATATLYYQVSIADRRVGALDHARLEAAHVVDLTTKREAAREAAHADVLKAQITLAQRERDLADGVLARDRARLELAVLLFPDPLAPYTLAEAATGTALPSLPDLEAAARHGNPELASALAALRQSNAEVDAAKAAYLPDLALNFTYGIDASYYATRSPDDGTGYNPRNLGYSMAATLDIPVWNWFSTAHRVKQSEIRRDAVAVALTAAQKRLVVGLRESLAEAATAETQLASLDTSEREAADSLALTELRYTAGEATVLEVVDAENTLLAAQTAHEDGEVRYREALTNLDILAGSL